MHSDFSAQVMTRIIVFEKRRVFFWFLRTMLLLVLLITCASFFLWSLLKEIFRISNYQKDTLLGFWQRMPYPHLWSFSITVLALLLVMIYIHRKIPRLKQKLVQIKHFHFQPL